MTDSTSATATQLILDQAVSAAKPVLSSQLGSLRTSFVTLFGSLATDKDLLEQAFSDCCLAKLAMLESRTPSAYTEARQAYALNLDAIERLGLKTVIIGEASAGSILRQVAHLLITGLAAGAGAGVSAAIAIYLPGLGAILGPIAGAGVKELITELAP